jgi:hypothetical protein
MLKLLAGENYISQLAAFSQPTNGQLGTFAFNGYSQTLLVLFTPAESPAPGRMCVSEEAEDVSGTLQSFRPTRTRSIMNLVSRSCPRSLRVGLTHSPPPASGIGSMCIRWVL